MSMQLQVRDGLMANYHLLLERLRDHPQLDSASYKLFAPRTGQSYDRELMLVGRALYGWGTASLKKAFLQQGINEAIEEAWKYWDEGICPLAAVIAHWESEMATGKSNWNMRKSQFWMVAREVVIGLGLPSHECPFWYSRLYWTNLYKVNPASTGNLKGRS
jgi:hypothetical protein